MGHTYQHPHRKPDPGALVQLHHEIDIHEDAQDGKDWQEGHLRTHKVAASALTAESWSWYLFTSFNKMT